VFAIKVSIGGQISHASMGSRFTSIDTHPTACLNTIEEASFDSQQQIPAQIHCPADTSLPGIQPQRSYCFFPKHRQKDGKVIEEK
jgi:hypothetical protein